MIQPKNIGIIGAMEVEIEEFKSRFGNVETEEFAGYKFYKAFHEGKSIVFCYSKVGKVFSTMAASIMIAKYGIDYLIFSGIAGALNEDYRVLDICIATKTCQHDVDITAFGHPKGFLSESGGVYVDGQNELMEIAKVVALENNIDLKEGVVATGDQFIGDPGVKRGIKEEFDADMIEMEGGSVAVVAQQCGIPFLITRTISDSASGDGLMEFNEFTKAAAVKNANFVMKIIESI